MEPGGGGEAGARARREIRRKSMDLLARREHSRLELGRKLEERRYDPSLIEEVLDALESERLLSDERFAAALVRSRVERGYGPLRIRAELSARGVGDEVAAAHLELDDEAWIERSREVRHRRFGPQPPGDRAEEVRQARFLAGRGFTTTQIGIMMRRERSGGGG